MYKILVVEDDPMIMKTLKIRFTAEKFEFIAAQDAIQAISIARKSQPDLIVLDISMPGGSGLQVAEKLQNLTQTMCTPIIFITAHKDKGYYDKAMSLGAAGYFEKPFDSKELIEEIKRILGEE